MSCKKQFAWWFKTLWPWSFSKLSSSKKSNYLRHLPKISAPVAKTWTNDSDVIFSILIAFEMKNTISAKQRFEKFWPDSRGISMNLSSFTNIWGSLLRIRFRMSTFVERTLPKAQTQLMKWALSGVVVISFVRASIMPEFASFYISLFSPRAKFMKIWDKLLLIAGSVDVCRTSSNLWVMPVSKISKTLV